MIVIYFLSSHAFGYGGVTKTETAVIDEGNSAIFEILLWGDNESLEIFTKEAPQKWEVTTDPKELFLTSGSGDEIVSVNEKLFKAKIVRITVKPFVSDEGGVVIGVKGKKNSNGIVFYQETLFRFGMKTRKIDIISGANRLLTDFAETIFPTAKSDSHNNMNNQQVSDSADLKQTQKKEKEDNKITGMLTNGSINITYVAVVFVLGLLLILFKFYRDYRSIYRK